MSERHVEHRRPAALAGFAGAAVVLAVAEIGGSWYFGFGGLAPQLWLGALTVLLVWPSWRLVRACFRGEDDLAAIFVRTACVAFGCVVCLGFVLGSTRHLTLPWYLVGELVILLAALAFTRPPPSGSPSAEVLPPLPLVGLWVAVVAFVIGHGLSHSPYTAYDAVSYHLFFPARWLEAHQLAIIPTPFSDEAQAYQPSNGELWTLWLMLPFHGDILARVAQIPFYLLGATATYLLARRCGASARAAAFAPTFFLLAPPLVQQAVGADVDLIAASMFVAAIYLGVCAAESDRTRDWLLWGCAAGLFLGTKYLALVYLPVLLLVPQCRGIRWRALWGAPGLVTLGAPWYIRNWVVAGSPIYPATLTAGGVTIARGAYSHAAMLQSFMHTTAPRLLAVSLVHAFGTTYFSVAAPLAIAAIAGEVWRRRWWPLSALAIAIAAVIALCWVSVGDNTDARFLLPAVALLPAILPLVYNPNGRTQTGVDLVMAAAIVWILIGLDRDWLLNVPWFMADWLPWRGLISRDFLVLFGAVTLVAGCFCMLASRRHVLGAAAIGLAVAAGVTLAIEAESWCLPGRCDYLPIDSPHFRTTYLFGARWLGDHVHGANVAYAGLNLPYPLGGSRLSNTVYYVNIDNHWTWRFDQYAKAFAEGAPAQSAAAALAQPSGVLMPAADPHDAIRPRFERRVGDPEAWKINLRRDAIGWLFVATLDPYEIDYVWHNAQKFPIEDEWARHDPQDFQLVYENDEVRIYLVNLPMTPRAR